MRTPRDAPAPRRRRERAGRRRTPAKICHALLDRDVCTDFRGDGLRISPHFFNDEADIDRLLRGAPRRSSTSGADYRTDDRDPLHQVVREAVVVPRLLTGLDVARVVGRADHELVLPGRGGPVDGSSRATRTRADGLRQTRVAPRRPAVDAHLDAERRAPARTMLGPRSVTGPASSVLERVKNSGKPGGIISARGVIRVTACPRPPRAVADGRPASGSPRTARRRPDRRSHFTLVMPYQPGTSRRTGKPCCGGSGWPFICVREDHLLAASRPRPTGCARSPVPHLLGCPWSAPVNTISTASGSEPRLLEDRAERRSGPLGVADGLVEPRLAQRSRSSRARPFPAHSIVTAA